MEEYDFQVEHRPGVKHGNADALSRRPCHVKSCACWQSSKTEAVRSVDQLQAVTVVETNSTQPSLSEYVAYRNRNVLNQAVSVSENDESSPIIGYWSQEGLRTAQEEDPDIDCILQLMKQSFEKPPWESVSLHSHDARVLWSMWPRLRVHDGLLQRKFETPDGISVNWQIVLPSKLRREFLTVIHGGMTGGHLARRRTAASIQARAYWPKWSSDLDTFLRECEPCARYRRGNAPRKAQMQTLLVGEP